MFGFGQPNGQKWILREKVDLTGPEPDWKVVESAGEAEEQRV